MPDVHFAPCCGIYCGDCPFLDTQCTGCGHVKGKPFWTAQMPGGVCPLYDCCRNRKILEHCGLCPEFPCRTFLELRDPNMTEEAFQKALKDRRESLTRRTAIGTAPWLAQREAEKEAL